jgi:hypothetical protein
MRERQQFEELSTVVALGLLAEDMVMVVGRVLRTRAADLPDRDRRIVENARRLFEALSEQSTLPTSAARERMVVDDAYRDTMRILRERVMEIDQGGREAAANLVVLLDAVLGGHVTDEQIEQLARLREVFVEVGKTMLTRSNELMRSRQETIGAWPPMQAISLSS